ncbi:MAG TPA: four helix bundle protein [Gemmatimonadaceae bacterium]|nr:four helix bundle protein [Gemmatimonadaceae bacterium]
MGDYRKLEVYQLSTTFSDRVVAFARRLPAHLGDKRDQLGRAADSIHEAIPEGCGLNSDAQLLKNLRIALGSANECEDVLNTLDRRGYLPEEEQELIEIARRICAMLAKFIARVEGDQQQRKRSAELRAERARRQRERADSRSHSHSHSHSERAESEQPQRASPKRGADAESEGPQPSG